MLDSNPSFKILVHSVREHAAMPTLYRKRFVTIGIAFFVVFLYYTLFSLPRGGRSSTLFGSSHGAIGFVKSSWAQRQQHFPVTTLQKLPKGRPHIFPQVQHTFSQETTDARKVRETRLAAVQAAFLHSWKGYKDHAWMRDELMPLSGGGRSSYGRWSATLVDTLDTLWIMDLHQEFDEAVAAVADIDFETSTAEQISLFETTIRYLGGLISAYDLSQHPLLLQKAIQLGEMLFTAFDTPNRMPVPYWEWQNARDDGPQDTALRAASADIGSLTMEFTRLSQITGDHKFFDAVQRISDLFVKQQNLTSIPGLWPVFVNAQAEDFATGDSYSFGALSDSLYEYYPKMHVLLGGQMPMYGKAYGSFIEAAKKHIFFRPMNPDNKLLLVPGNANTPDGKPILDPSAQHLGCFVGGMLGIASRIFSSPSDLGIAEQLTDGCVWGYDALPSGIMPETTTLVPCPSTPSATAATDNTTQCSWSDSTWHSAVTLAAGSPANFSVADYIAANHLPRGIVSVVDARYILRPEAIESVFIMYRLTGNKEWQDKAWRMFESIEKATRTEYAYAAIENVLAPELTRTDHMESFWTAETLKYFYLIFCEDGVVSLDEWVFNTEAHPFKRPVRKGWFGW